LESLNFIPSSLAAIAKAVTGAYLSTGGNAFSTRTASQIIQENFNPGERNVPSGPLFGVQFSNLACSDFSQRYNSGAAASPGPHRSPLGLSADPGGLPLYIDGVPVGGVGVVADGIYGLDKIISDFDQDLDELIATSATRGYAAPLGIRADQISLVGKTARFSDATVADLQSNLASVRSLTTIRAASDGDYAAVPGYFAGTGALAGTAFGQPASGIRPADATVFRDADGNSLDAFIFVDSTDQNRYPASAGTDTPAGDVANTLTATEVQTILNEAIGVANQSRAQIRVPVGTPARVTVSVVDTNGNILGMARTRDGPMFGADVSLQKARTATFFSGTGRQDGSSPAEILSALPAPQYLAPLPEPVDLSQGLSVLNTPAPTIPGYLLAAKIFFADPLALEPNGTPVAFADRSGGNLSRPHFPDGPESGPPGPFSKPAGEWSVFSVGLQSDLVYNALIHHIGFVFGLVPDVPQNCTGDTGLATVNPFTAQGAVSNLRNGIQIFPGSVPIYRGDVLVGGIGVSGDGVDQDDMISFLGVHRAGLRLGTGIHNAPPEIRADRIDIPGQSSRLRYVNCPQLPFIDSSETEVCDGI
ncbi:MAG: heme-binding protein, partial [Pseudomonadales bacterium]|nr:heme-binding protein [Pseudomonadales bacterium]